MATIVQPLAKEEVISVIEGTGRTSRVPLQIHLWVHQDTFGDRTPLVQEILDRYPEDIQMFSIPMPGVVRGPDGHEDYRWVPFHIENKDNTPLDQASVMPDWSRLDEVVANFPRADRTGLFDNTIEGDGRYLLARWWFCFFERHWSLRGMTNALMDYYTNPDEVHRLFRKLTDFYKELIKRVYEEKRADGILTGDDLGTQTGPFFSPAIYEEFFRPYFDELFQFTHDLGMHFWLHSCGNVTAFVPSWIRGGLDVLHPIQKHAMDERAVTQEHGGDLTVFVGLDVQRVIPWGTPDDVRREVRYLLDTCWRPGEGKCILTAGNGINEDCTVDSLEAFFDEAISYGSRIVRDN
jgi:uroporphyrinogen decarboxylase